MSNKVYIEPLGLKLLKVRLKKINEAMTNTKTPISRIAVVLYQSVMKNFKIRNY